MMSLLCHRAMRWPERAAGPFLVAGSCSQRQSCRLRRQVSLKCRKLSCHTTNMVSELRRQSLAIALSIIEDAAVHTTLTTPISQRHACRITCNFPLKGQKLSSPSMFSSILVLVLVSPAHRGSGWELQLHLVLQSQYPLHLL